jgi:cytochrome c553
MARALRIVAYVLATVVGIALLAGVLIYMASERRLDRRYWAKREIAVRPTAAAIADAPRQAQVLGCLSCHGAGLRGNDVYDEPKVGAIIAPNLPQLIKGRTDQQLAVAIRQGISADGRPLLVMPSAIYSRLSPQDVSALIVWMRSLPADKPPAAPFRLTLIGRLFVLNGDLPLQPDLVARYQRDLPVDLGPKYALGRYIAASNCAECHGPVLRGGKRPYADINPSIGPPQRATPDLAIVGAYDLAQFTKLLRTGVPVGGRDLGIMSETARSDFSHFNDAEIAALHAYLQERAKRQ